MYLFRATINKLFRIDNLIFICTEAVMLFKTKASNHLSKSFTEGESMPISDGPGHLPPPPLSSPPFCYQFSSLSTIPLLLFSQHTGRNVLEIQSIISLVSTTLASPMYSMLPLLSFAGMWRFSSVFMKKRKLTTMFTPCQVSSMLAVGSHFCLFGFQSSFSHKTGAHPGAKFSVYLLFNCFSSLFS